MTFSNFGRSMRSWTLALGVAVLLPGTAAAQERLSVGLEAGYRGFTNAPDSTKAIFGDSGGITFGASLRVPIGDSMFVSAHGQVISKDGERVFVADPSGEVFPLGHPLTLKVVPVYGMFGYRFLPDSSVRPYAAGGAGVAFVSEESTVGGVTESTSATKFMALGALGVEWGQDRFRVGAEAGYSVIPSSLEGQVAGVYGEDDLGGLFVLGRVSFIF